MDSTYEELKEIFWNSRNILGRIILFFPFIAAVVVLPVFIGVEGIIEVFDEITTK